MVVATMVLKIRWLQDDPDVKALGEELEGVEAARAMLQDAGAYLESDGASAAIRTAAC